MTAASCICILLLIRISTVEIVVAFRLFYLSSSLEMFIAYLSFKMFSQHSFTVSLLATMLFLTISVHKAIVIIISAVGSGIHFGNGGHRDDN